MKIIAIIQEAGSVPVGCDDCGLSYWDKRLGRCKCVANDKDPEDWDEEKIDDDFDFRTYKPEWCPLIIEEVESKKA